MFTKIELENLGDRPKTADFLLYAQRRGRIKPAHRGGTFIGGHGSESMAVIMQDYRVIILPKGGIILPDMKAEDLLAVLDTYRALLDGYMAKLDKENERRESLGLKHCPPHSSTPGLWLAEVSLNEWPKLLQSLEAEAVALLPQAREAEQARGRFIPIVQGLVSLLRTRYPLVEDERHLAWLLHPITLTGYALHHVKLEESYGVRFEGSEYRWNEDDMARLRTAVATFIEETKARLDRYEKILEKNPRIRCETFERAGYANRLREPRTDTWKETHFFLPVGNEELKDREVRYLTKRLPHVVFEDI